MNPSSISQVVMHDGYFQNGGQFEKFFCKNSVQFYRCMDFKCCFSERLEYVIMAGARQNLFKWNRQTNPKTVR